MQTYLYVIAARPSGPCKLGRSADPDRRLRQLQTGQPEALILYHAEPVAEDEVASMERALHETITYKRMQGEWFNISVEDAIAEVRHAVMLYSDNLRPRSNSDILQDFTGL